MDDSKFVDYSDGNFHMQGFMARMQAHAKQPIVLVVHDWRGCVEFAQEKAKYFAKLGYFGFAVDLFGKGKRGSDTDKGVNQKLIGEVLENRPCIVSRLNAAIACAQEFENVQTDKIIAIGFCFGGLCVLDLARSGAKLSGVISVHGLLNPPANNDTSITAKVLALHGYHDKSVTPQTLTDFHAEMDRCKADWQSHVFGKAYHAFTNPKAHDIEAGLMYDRDADARTWDLVRAFTAELFG